MPSAIEVCNFALAECSSPQIVSLQENVKGGAVASLLFGQVLDAALTRSRWSFSIQKALLPASTEIPLFSYNYVYNQPADALSLVELAGYAIGAPSLGAVYNDETLPPYQLEGNRIHCDFAAPLKTRWIFRVTNPNLWHPLFTQMMVWDLAERFCSPLANRATERKQFYRMKTAEVEQRAVAVNAIELPPDENDDGSWVLSRIGP